MFQTTKCEFIPLKIVSSANIREHWAKKHRRDKLQRMAVSSYINVIKDKVRFPCIILLTRVAPRKLDDDNLAYAFKGIRDCVCSIILPNLAPGRADGDSRLWVKYDQVSHGPKVYGFFVTLIYDENGKNNNEET